MPIHEVPPEQCERIRRHYKSGSVMVKTVADEESLHCNTVRSHLVGNCSHDISEQPVDTEDIDNHRVVDAELCSEIRKTYIENPKTCEISDRFDIPYPTIKYHVQGQCSHAEDDISSPLDVHLVFWGTIYQKYMNGTDVSTLAIMYRTSEKTIRKIIRRYGSYLHEEGAF